MASNLSRNKKLASGDFEPAGDTQLGAGVFTPSRGNPVMTQKSLVAAATGQAPWAPPSASPSSQPTGGVSSGPNPQGIAGVYSRGNPITPYVGGSIKL